MRRLCGLVTWVLISLGASMPVAAEPGLAVLQLAAGARAAALGQATTALVDATAAASNPAALGAGRATALSHTQWIGGIRHEHASTTWGSVDGGRYGVELLLSHAGDLQRRMGPTEQSLGVFGVYEWTAAVAWSRPLGDHLRGGINGKYVRQSIDTESASGGAVDLGLQYGDGPWWFGASLRNLGRMNNLTGQATELPLQLRLGAATVRGPLLLSTDVHWTRDVDTTVHAGLEYSPRTGLLLRAGYQSADTRNVSLGLGVCTGPWRVDYAYVPFSSGLGQAHHLSLIWSGNGSADGDR